jgi:hypothetical protein
MVGKASPREIELWKEMRLSMNNFNGKVESVTRKIKPNQFA